MRIDKNFAGLEYNGANRVYMLNMDLVSDEAIEVDLNKLLVIHGCVVSKKDIVIRRGIRADGFIRAGGFIKSGGFIQAYKSIQSDEFIKSGGFIKSGEFIQAYKSIQSDEFIKSGGFIKSGEFIQSGGFIQSGRGIVSDQGIESKTFIDVKYRIFAGASAWCSSDDCDDIIKCAKLYSGEIVSGRLVIKESDSTAE